MIAWNWRACDNASPAQGRVLAREGVTIVDPACTYIDAGVVVGRDTIIEPGVSLLGQTRIGEACTVKAWSTLTDAVLLDGVTVRQNCVVTASRLETGTIIGPFSHLRRRVIEEGGVHRQFRGSEEVARRAGIEVHAPDVSGRRALGEK
jgi:bifunctional N-acetylglucosamine-1-phosphate-uridyltransferase/glucosamine-1-phosphate-acetyltransferase GlmU-like protein